MQLLWVNILSVDADSPIWSCICRYYRQIEYLFVLLVKNPNIFADVINGWPLVSREGTGKGQGSLQPQLRPSIDY